jgi:hypothetical protein
MSVHQSPTHGDPSTPSTPTRGFCAQRASLHPDSPRLVGFMTSVVASCPRAPERPGQDPTAMAHPSATRPNIVAPIPSRSPQARFGNPACSDHGLPLG